MTSPTRRPATRQTRPVRPPAGVELGVGVAVLVVTALGVALLPRSDAVARTLVVALAVGVFALWAHDWRPALATAGIAFLVVDGFLVDQYGELAWHGAADWLRLAALLAAAAVGTMARRQAGLRAAEDRMEREGPRND